MKVIYISGPIAAPTAWDRENNIRLAEGVALDLWRTGKVVPICPHTAARFYDGTLPHEVWIAGDLELLRRSDALLLLPGWEKSLGAKQEVRFAREGGIPVMESVGAATEWARSERSQVMGDAAKCGRCDGCGKIASDEDGTPWTYWMALPLGSSAAVLAGIVRPLDCPACSGSGKASTT